MRNLVVCCDGTWNTPDDMDQGLPTPTNVFKLYRALNTADGQQLAYYHPGVGTDGTWWARVSGGAVGQGLSDNIKSAYRWLAGHYRQGDNIWLFGFSRGAYTARSLGGMISRCGLLDGSRPGLDDKEVWSNVDELFAAYRKKKTLMPKGKRTFHNVAAGQSPFHSTRVRFIGVWDTVGSLGVPDDLALLNLIDDPARYHFHDTTLSPIVDFGRHAIAMDESRHSFVPTLWQRPTEGATDLVQRWFPGVHSDVGGGYAQPGLSNGALLWMISEAETAGLQFLQNAKAQIVANPGDVLHNSHTGVFKALKTLPRAVPRIDGPEADTVFHSSVFSRRANPPISSSDYWLLRSLQPGKTVTVDVFARERWNATGIYLEEGVTYDFSAKGEWMDASIACGPDGPKGGSVKIGEIAHVASSLFGEAENLYKWLSGTKATDFWWTKRHEEFAFFALIGVIASGERPGAKPDDPLHETFLIGKSRTYKAPSSGYLYCFANDAWHAYSNNKGSVQLSVTR